MNQNGKFGLRPDILFADMELSAKVAKALDVARTVLENSKHPVIAGGNLLFLFFLFFSFFFFFLFFFLFFRRTATQIR